jgi:hypothetical protein
MKSKTTGTFLRAMIGIGVSVSALFSNRLAQMAKTQTSM